MKLLPHHKKTSKRETERKKKDEAMRRLIFKGFTF